MSFKNGCLKPALFGCLGLIALVVLLTAITSFSAWRGLKDQRIETQELEPVAVAPLELPAGPAGRLVLDLAHGEFEISPGAPGTGVQVRARYDLEAYHLEDDLKILPDSTWVYTVRYFRTISGLQAFARAIIGGGNDSRVEITIAPDAPIILEANIQQGGAEAEFGGLWITAADIEFSKGGLAMSISEPLHQPMEHLYLHGSMGGIEAAGLGNASPSVLTVDCAMGGADIDLRGRWLNDCDADLSINMGGLAVTVPDDVEVQGVTITGGEMRRTDRETPIPVLRLKTSAKRGEVEVMRR